MKLLFCETCGDIIAPHRANNVPRWCDCKRHAVWWTDRFAGMLEVWDRYPGPKLELACYIIGLPNYGLLQAPDQPWTKEFASTCLTYVKPGNLFDRSKSLVWRARPGALPNIAMSDKLPTS